MDPFEIQPESGLGGRWPTRWRPGTSVEGGTRFWPSGVRVYPIWAIVVILCFLFWFIFALSILTSTFILLYSTIMRTWVRTSICSYVQTMHVYHYGCCAISLLIVVVFTLNRYFYPTTSAEPPVSFLILHPRDIQITWSQTVRQRIPNAKESR